MRLSLLASGLGALLLLPLLSPPAASAQSEGPPEAVTVKVLNDGKPVAGQQLRVIGEPPGGGQITFGEGKTDDAGLFLIQAPFRPGVVLFAEGTYEGVKYTSPQVAMAGAPGSGITLEVTVFSAGSATLQDLSFGADSHISIDVQEGFLEITQVLFIINKSKGAYAPEEGFALSLPAGHREVNGVGGNPVFALEHVGASIPGPFLPGQTEIQVRFELPFDSSTVEYRQKLKIPWASARAFIKESPGLEFAGPQVTGQELREASGIQWRLASLRPKDGEVRFTLSGLEVRSHQGRWIALGLAVLVGCLGFLGGLMPVREDEETESTARKALLAEQSSLLAELASATSRISSMCSQTLARSILATIKGSNPISVAAARTSITSWAVLTKD